MFIRTKKYKEFDKSQAVFEFYKNYANIVAPILKEEEEYRKSQFGLFLFVILVTCILAGILVFSNFAPLIMFVVLIAVIVENLIYNNFRKRIKQRCMPLLLDAFGDITWYQESDMISDVDLEQSELFSTYNRRSNDDSFIGTYKGVQYEVSETSMHYETGSGRRKMIWPVFNGVVISFDSNKLVKNKTIITTKGDVNVRNAHPLVWLIGISLAVYFLPMLLTSNLLDVIISALPQILIIVGVIFLALFFIRKDREILNEIKLEDPEFEKRYKAYSSDEIEGRYLITPTFMERFRTLHTSFGTTKAKCSFYGNKVMFAISTRKNLFEIGDLYTPLTNPKQINTFLSEISAIYDLIDYFKLDEKTGV